MCDQNREVHTCFNTNIRIGCSFSIINESISASLDQTCDVETKTKQNHGMITQHCYHQMRAGIQLGRPRQAHGSRGRAFFPGEIDLAHITNLAIEPSFHLPQQHRVCFLSSSTAKQLVHTSCLLCDRPSHLSPFISDPHSLHFAPTFVSTPCTIMGCDATPRL